MTARASVWPRRIMACAFLMIAMGRPASCQVSAILAGGLVDPATGQLAVDQTILVDKGTITAVGSKLPIPNGAEVIDLSKDTVLPGLMDAHTHSCATVDARWDLGFLGQIPRWGKAFGEIRSELAYASSQDAARGRFAIPSLRLGRRSQLSLRP